MKVKFKNSLKQFECTNFVEQKIYRAGADAGWMLSIQIEDDDITSEIIDANINPETIDEIAITDGDNTFLIKGYQTIGACVIKSCRTVDVQLQKIKEVN